MVGRKQLPGFLVAVCALLMTGCSSSGPAATETNSPPSSARATTETAPDIPRSQTVLQQDPSLPAVTSDGGPSSASSAPTEVPAPPPSEASTAAELPECTPATLATRTPGVLTLATADPMAAPWFTGQDPRTSDGYEAQVASKVAATLGYGAAQQNWLVVKPESALDGSPAGFDLFIGQVRDSVANTADFSSGYYSITDAIVMTKIAAASLSNNGPDYQDLRVGVIGGSTGQTAMLEKGVTSVQSFDTPGQLSVAVSSGAVDIAVLPTPDALAASRADTALAVIGQLPTGRWQPEQFHIVLAKDSALTACVSAALDRLRVEGTLDQLTAQWITGPLAPLLS